MIHKTLEEWFDTLLYVGIIMGLLLFFSYYWSTEYQFRYAKAVLQEFLDKTAVSGKLTGAEYERLQLQLDDICPGFKVDIRCYTYRRNPQYALITEDIWRKDFQEKNIRKEKVFEEYKPEVQQERAENLRYQTETNETLISGITGEFLPLPSEEYEISVCAVRPNQEVYEKEPLITLCKISTPQGVYYQTASPASAQESGEVLLELTLDSAVYFVSVNVVCHSRTVLCEYGHVVVNTKELISEARENGNFSCPYCALIPENVFCDAMSVNLQTGEALTSDAPGIWVTFLDEHMEYVTPDCEEWQDDYDKNYCGTQEVTIRYRNKETMLTAITENPACIQCGGMCNDRCLADYEKYPYCIACLSELYVETGELQEEEQLLTGKELLECLAAYGEILLQRNDLAVTVFQYRGETAYMQREIKLDGRSGEGI